MCWSSYSSMRLSRWFSYDDPYFCPRPMVNIPKKKIRWSKMNNSIRKPSFLRFLMFRMGFWWLLYSLILLSPWLPAKITSFPTDRVHLLTSATAPRKSTRPLTEAQAVESHKSWSDLPVIRDDSTAASGSPWLPNGWETPFVAPNGAPFHGECKGNKDTPSSLACLTTG